MLASNKRASRTSSWTRRDPAHQGSVDGNYLLYQHYGLPFSQPASYVPSGSFADGITCYTGTGHFNTSNGGWLRNNTFDTGIVNQSSIDLSLAVDKALGWVYPSSGLVQVTVCNLP